jgi:phage terminase small subunit
MPRRSAADIAAASYAPPSRAVTLAPPDSLSAGARKVFVGLVHSLPPDHFEPSDVTLLEAYCEAAALARQMVPKLASDRNALMTWAASIMAWRSCSKPDAGASLAQHARKRGLADLKRIAPQVVAVQLDQVEGV